MANIPHTPRTAKSARRGLSLALLGVLAVVVAAGIAWAATDTTSPPKFYLSATPSSQTVTPGQAANYKLALDRQNHFIAPVSVSV